MAIMSLRRQCTDHYIIGLLKGTAHLLTMGSVRSRMPSSCSRPIGELAKQDVVLLQ